MSRASSRKRAARVARAQARQAGKGRSKLAHAPEMSAKTTLRQRMGARMAGRHDRKVVQVGPDKTAQSAWISRQRAHYSSMVSAQATAAGNDVVSVEAALARARGVYHRMLDEWHEDLRGADEAKTASAYRVLDEVHACLADAVSTADATVTELGGCAQTAQDLLSELAYTYLRAARQQACKVEALPESALAKSLAVRVEAARRELHTTFEQHIRESSNGTRAMRGAA